MYTVKFCDKVFATIEQDVNACALALDLHRLSNSAHEIIVSDEDGEIVLILTVE